MRIVDRYDKVSQLQCKERRHSVKLVITAKPVSVIHDYLDEMRYVLTMAEGTKKDITNFLYIPQITDL